MSTTLHTEQFPNSQISRNTQTGRVCCKHKYAPNQKHEENLKWQHAAQRNNDGKERSGEALTAGAQAKIKLIATFNAPSTTLAEPRTTGAIGTQSPIAPRQAAESSINRKSSSEHLSPNRQQQHH